jgi:hypothetical protein
LFLIFTGILQQDEKEKKRPGSRGSAKSKASQEKEAEPAQKSTPVQEEFWPVSTPIPVTPRRKEIKENKNNNNNNKKQSKNNKSPNVVWET